MFVEHLCHFNPKYLQKLSKLAGNTIPDIVVVVNLLATSVVFTVIIFTKKIMCIQYDENGVLTEYNKQRKTLPK